MSTGLEASTLTPGRMAPDESLTLPATAACENAGLDRKNTAAMTADPVASARIDGLLSGRHVREGVARSVPSLRQRGQGIKQLRLAVWIRWRRFATSDARSLPICFNTGDPSHRNTPSQSGLLNRTPSTNVKSCRNT